MTASPSVLPLQLGGGGYQISRSIRLRSSASANLTRTPSVASNRKTWTWSGWIKIGALGIANSALTGSANVGTCIRFQTDTLSVFDYVGAYNWQITTTQVFRDPSAWYHLVVALDTTQATASNRVKIYVNSTQITSFATATYPALNADGSVNNTVTQYIGALAVPAPTQFFDGYIAEVNFIDGQALTPSSFGTTDSNGIWQPKAYTGTYGTNGFYLKFTDNSAATAAAIGKDYSGNGNNWTPNNISVTAGTTYDSMIDSPTVGAGASNYCIANPLDKSTAITVTDGNLNVTTTAVANRCIVGSMGVSSGKWYWEATITAQPANGQIIGFTKGISNYDVYLGSDANSYSYAYTGQKGNSGSLTAYGATYTTNDVIGIALDLSAGTLVFYKNNVSQGTAFTGLSGTFFPAASTTQNCSFTVNFGQRPFTYTLPAGFAALNTYNLPAGTINNGATVMAASTYTGTGVARSISNGGNNTLGVTFKPDLVWMKQRSSIQSNVLQDSVRGATKYLVSDSTGAEVTDVQTLTSFNTDGFSLGTSTGINGNTSTYIGWQWQAGQGTTSSNTNGSITSTVSMNQSAGFSIVTYTGTGANATVGHGLGVAPKFVIVKTRSVGTYDWCVYHSSLTSASYYIPLNNTSAQTLSTNVWNATAPTSSVFSIGTSVATNQSSQTLVAYCWSEVAGYSKFGSYTGNGSADGPFVYCGFRPRFVMIKWYSGALSATNWTIRDTSRDIYNAATADLLPNASNAEFAGAAIDILSNGFKLRDAGGQETNYSGASYIFAAFAENPFNISRAR